MPLRLRPGSFHSPQHATSEALSRRLIDSLVLTDNHVYVRPNTQTRRYNTAGSYYYTQHSYRSTDGISA